MLPVAILCGGKGTRMREAGETLPKPLVEIGGKPILWHVMCLYATQGLSDFVLLLGYGADRIREFAQTCPWNVTCVDTGIETLKRGTFCLTYADGLADIDLAGLVDFHRAHGRAATVTVVRPQNPWGVAHIAADGRVDGFTEKPRLESWVNGGFFVMEPAALDRIGPDDILEREPLERLAGDGDLHAFQHEGFWDCMDTYKDNLLLNELWESGTAPWRSLVNT
jgi:glucose-1-phosphate cytidylyltransferase